MNLCTHLFCNAFMPVLKHVLVPYRYRMQFYDFENKTPQKSVNSQPNSNPKFVNKTYNVVISIVGFISFREYSNSLVMLK